MDNAVWLADNQAQSSSLHPLDNLSQHFSARLESRYCQILPLLGRPEQ